MEDGWRRAKTQGEVVLTQTGGARYKAAVAAVRERGFTYLNAEAIEGQELIARMRALVNPAAESHGADLEAPLKLQPKAEMEAVPPLMETRKALLGLIAEPKLSLQTLTRLLINTGLRPSEAIGLEAQDINLADPVPHVHVRANGVRSLKTAHSRDPIAIAAQ